MFVAVYFFRNNGKKWDLSAGSGRKVGMSFLVVISTMNSAQWAADKEHRQPRNRSMTLGLGVVKEAAELISMGYGHRIN